jgi:glycosyltransferase involved in cell wall biosynthesis
MADATSPAATLEAAVGRLSMLRRVLRGGGSPSPIEVDFVDVAEWERAGDAPLQPGAREAAGAASLRIAIVVPWLLEGSGGHDTILNLVRQLEGRGHELSLWVHDPGGRNDDVDAAATVQAWFGGMRGAVRVGFDGWSGADIAVATGWQTVHRVLMLEGCKGRAYLVQDHEPEFFAESAERRWADQTYRLGLHCITAGRWLRDLVTQNYGATASWFELGVDQSVYRPRAVERADAVVLAYSRTTTPRRAVPLLLLALAELKRRRPGVQIELFGDPRGTPRSLEARDRGVLDRDALAEVYSRATVGVVLSLTNYSLVAQEMLACGLPCVEADTPSTRAAYGPHETLSFAPLTVEGVAGELEHLLADPALRARRSKHGIEHVASRTWESATENVEGGLREALRLAGE